MHEDVEAYVKTCLMCQVDKTERRKQARFLQPLPIPKKPWVAISMHFVVGFPVVDGFQPPWYHLLHPQLSHMNFLECTMPSAHTWPAFSINTRGMCADYLMLVDSLRTHPILQSTRSQSNTQPTMCQTLTVRCLVWTPKTHLVMIRQHKQLIKLQRFAHKFLYKIIRTYTQL